MALGTQIATRLPQEDVDHLDDLVAAGLFQSRAEAVRAAVAALLDAQRRRETGEAIAEGYRRLPQDDREVADAEANLRSLIVEEPW